MIIIVAYTESLAKNVHHCENMGTLLGLCSLSKQNRTAMNKHQNVKFCQDNVSVIHIPS